MAYCRCIPDGAGCWTCYLITVLYADYRDMKEKQGFTFHDHTIQWYEILDGLLGPRWKIVGLVFNIGLLSCIATIQIIASASTVYYLNTSLPKRTWTLIFGPCLIITLLTKDAKNYRIWSFVNILMVIYCAWYMTVASAIYGLKEDVQHTGPHNFLDYYTGATNILYAFGGHALTVELMHAMWKPEKFKLVYFNGILFVLTCTLPSAITVYWIFGDEMLDHSNAFAVLPKSIYRDAGLVLALIHQFIMFGVHSLPIYMTWEKFLGIHGRGYAVQAFARIPVYLVMWLAALMFPFFGPIDSVVGAVFSSFAVYLVPCAAHMAYYRKSKARENVAEKLPYPLSWTKIYCINLGIIMWILLQVGFGLWASLHRLLKLIHTFGLFAKCYNCDIKYG